MKFVAATLLMLALCAPAWGTCDWHLRRSAEAAQRKCSDELKASGLEGYGGMTWDRDFASRVHMTLFLKSPSDIGRALGICHSYGFRVDRISVEGQETIGDTR